MSYQERSWWFPPTRLSVPLKGHVGTLGATLEPSCVTLDEAVQWATCLKNGSTACHCWKRVAVQGASAASAERLVNVGFQLITVEVARLGKFNQ